MNTIRNIDPAELALTAVVNVLLASVLVGALAILL